MHGFFGIGTGNPRPDCEIAQHVGGSKVALMHETRCEYPARKVEGGRAP